MTREQFIYALTASGCLLKDGKTWYEHNELIKCFEDLGLLEQESILDKIRAEIIALSPEPTAYDVVDGNPIKEAVWETLDDILQILDKYKAEQEK